MPTREKYAINYIYNFLSKIKIKPPKFLKSFIFKVHTLGPQVCMHGVKEKSDASEFEINFRFIY